MSDSVTPWLAACQASLSFTVSWSLLKFMSIGSVMLSNHLILCCPFSCLQSFSASGLFQWVGSLHQVAKVLEISFMTDWCDLLAVQGILRSLFQNHSLKVSILWHSTFFMVQVSKPCDHWEDQALTIWAFVSRAMSLLFNALSRFVIAFLPRSKCLLISWLQSSSTGILEPKKRKFVKASTFPPSIYH